MHLYSGILQLYKFMYYQFSAHNVIDTMDLPEAIIQRDGRLRSLSCDINFCITDGVV